MFFYDTTHHYVSGLDPIYLSDVHPELGQLNERLSHHGERDPAAAIGSQFATAVPGGVSYIFIGDYPAAPPPEWFNYMARSGGFARVYQDSESTILQIVSQAPGEGTASDVPTMNNPEQRHAILPQVHRRFGREVYATDAETAPGGPALVIHNKEANEQWAQRVFANDAQSISGELLWQLGFRLYVITNEKQSWVMEVKGNPKYRSAFSHPSTAPHP